MNNTEHSETARPFRSGFVALVGRPNAGKSTLVNAVVGSKVAITSNTPQTTRHRIRAVLNRDDAQLVLVDTPGLHKPHDALGEELNRSALKSLEDVDVVAFLVDATKPIGKGDVWVAEHVKRVKAHRILVITKADLAKQGEVDNQITRAKALGTWDDIVVVSSVKGFNVEGFIEASIAALPEGPRWFPEDMDTDQTLEVMISEFIREKVLRGTFEEVPHSIGVQVEQIDHDPKRDFWTIYAIIYVEHDSQKGIIIGKNGEKIKRIGTEARTDLIKLLGGGVHLDLNVKVKKDWRRDSAQIRRFGYGEGL